jgi:hypothetical protein
MRRQSAWKAMLEGCKKTCGAFSPLFVVALELLKVPPLDGHQLAVKPRGFSGKAFLVFA